MPLDASLNRRALLKLGAVVGAGLGLPAVSTAVMPALDRAVNCIIRHATVLPMTPDTAAAPDTDVWIREGRIMAVGKGLQGEGAELIDATGMIVIPGLVDAHWHLWNSILRNSAPAPGGEAFFKSQVAISKRFTPEMAALGVQMGLMEAMNAGITTVNNWAHNLRNPAFAQAELKAMFESGLRGRFWYGYPQDLAPSAAIDFADIERVQLQFQSVSSSRFDLGLAIRGPERTERRIWEAEFAFAGTQGLPLSTHIAVTAQAQKAKALQQLARKGLLGPSVQLVHATHVDAEDIHAIAQSGASVCLTPLTEMRVGYGIAPVNALHQAKIPLTQGIDTLVLSGNANPFMVMQTLLNLAVGVSGNEQALTARDVLYWATQGAADAMGLGSELGSITPGKRADIALIDTRRLGMFPNNDPFATVVQSTTPEDVNTVIADGRVLKLDGKLMRGDFVLLSQQVDRALKSL